MAEKNVKMQSHQYHGIDEILDEHTECRVLMHAWSYNTAKRIPGGFEQTLRCSRCGSVKTQYLNKHGEIQSSRYSYADGYVIAGLGFLDAKRRGSIRTRALQKRIRGEEK